MAEFGGTLSSKDQMDVEARMSVQSRVLSNSLHRNSVATNPNLLNLNTLDQLYQMQETWESLQLRPPPQVSERASVSQKGGGEGEKQTPC